MKEIPNITLYACDHCGKKYQRKHHCAHHEQYMCRKNPNNQHACFCGADCDHLKREKETEYLYHYNGSEAEMNYTTFRCAKTDEEMYTYRMHERRALYQFVSGKRMPIKCKHFECKDITNNNY